MREKFPDHILWRAPIFQTESYRTFASQVRVSPGSESLTVDDSIRHVAPQLMATLQEIFTTNQNSMALLRSEFAEVKARNEIISAQLSVLVETNERVGDAFRGRVVSLTAAAIEPPAATSTTDASQIPSYRMNQFVTTVPNLWQEWTEGFQGEPAVSLLLEQHGVTWCPDDAARRFFKRRQAILNWIIANSENGEVNRTIRALEAYRTSNQKSLDFLGKNITKIPVTDILD